VGTRAKPSARRKSKVNSEKQREDYEREGEIEKSEVKSNVEKYVGRSVHQ